MKRIVLIVGILTLALSPLSLATDKMSKPNTMTKMDQGMMMPGLPKYITGFAAWDVVAKNLNTGGPHPGMNKMVFGNKKAVTVWKSKANFPSGSILIKTAGDAKAPEFVAIMNKDAQGWHYAEYSVKDKKYSLVGKGADCSGCHNKAKDNDYSFTRK